MTRRRYISGTDHDLFIFFLSGMELPRVVLKPFFLLRSKIVVFRRDHQMCCLV